MKLWLKLNKDDKLLSEVFSGNVLPEGSNHWQWYMPVINLEILFLNWVMEGLYFWVKYLIKKEKSLIYN